MLQELIQMMEKIDWYKEVLELEPNSKVFFPLARLLVQENRVDEAIRVLENGLDRHKEYLEARLFLIELLYQSGRREECDEQISDLSAVLTSYAGFWQAWAACLASSEASTATTLRLLAAQFLYGPISLNDAVARGVEEIVKERGAKEKREDLNAYREGSENHPDKAPKVVARSIVAPAANPPEAVDEPAAVLTGAEPDPSSCDAAVCDTSSAEPRSEETPSGIDVVLPEEDGGKSDLSLIEEMAKPTDAPYHGLKTETGDAYPLSGAYDFDSGEKLDREDEDEADDEAREEHFSIRTRSMADVLASQGDFDGAIDIYRELLSAAAPGEEEELKGRIASLRERKEQAASGESSPVSKEKLINILEALAQRVEERVNNPADI